MTLVLLKFKPVENPEAFPYHAFMMTPIGMEGLRVELEARIDMELEDRPTRIKTVSKLVKTLPSCIRLSFPDPGWSRINFEKVRDIENNLRAVCQDGSISLEILNVIA